MTTIPLIIRKHADDRCVCSMQHQKKCCIVINVLALDDNTPVPSSAMPLPFPFGCNQCFAVHIRLKNKASASAKLRKTISKNTHTKRACVPTKKAVPSSAQSARFCYYEPTILLHVFTWHVNFMQQSNNNVETQTPKRKCIGLVAEKKEAYTTTSMARAEAPTIYDATKMHKCINSDGYTISVALTHCMQCTQHQQHRWI